MSTNEEEKAEGSKPYPLDLASKLTVKTVVEIPKGAPVVMTAQPLRRVLTQATVTNVSSGTSPVAQTISIVPQAMLKQSLISNQNQLQSSQSGLPVARPTQITLTTSVLGQSQTGGTTYHVPRGPAVVANLAAPRSAVATPIRAPGIATTPTGQPSSSYVATVRPVTPTRAPSPANSALSTGTTWLSTAGIQVQSSGQIAKSVSNSANSGTSTTGNTTIAASLQRIATTTVASVTATVSRAPIVARAQSTTPVTTTVSTPRQALLHSAITINQNNPQISFKAGRIQTISNAVTVAQVLPSSTQTLVYSTGNTPHFTASPRIPGTAAVNTQRQVTAARPTQVMTTRLTVPVSVSQTATRLAVTPGPIYTAGAKLTTISAQSQNSIIGASNNRLTVNNSSQSATVGRLAVNSSPGTLIATTQARLTVANPSQPPSAVVIGAQTARLSGNVVSLHPVVVANSSQATRTLQTQGPKVLTQSAQGSTIQLTQVPTVAKIPAQSQVVPVTVATNPTRTINITPATIVSQRPVAVTSGTQAIPIAKVFPQGTRVTLESTESSNSVQSSNQPTNVYIHTAPMMRRSTSPGSVSSSQTESSRTPATTSVSTYSLPSGATYYYETGSGYSVASGNLVATRSFTPSSGSFAAVPQNANAQIRSTGIMSGQPIQFNPVMVVGQKSASQFLEPTSSTGLLQTSTSLQQEHNPLPSIGKITSSPRPSILRKRDNEGSPLKAAKNLTPMLATLTSAPTSPPSRPDSRGNGGNSSGGSTTISATSSPGLGEHEDSLPLPSVNTVPTPAVIAVKLEQTQKEQQREEEKLERVPEMSPRKKPRKQQLVGNDEPKLFIDDMQFLSESRIKKDVEETKEKKEPIVVPESHNNNEIKVKKPAPVSLLNSYRQNWKSANNHYLRYTDVKPKDERRPTIIDLANQNRVMQKIDGWKIHHLSAQMEDLSDMETQVYEKLTSMLKLIETQDCSGYDKEFNRIKELIKGNMQRSKIINDSTNEAKGQVMKIFDHKDHVADIISRCASKRNFKKRDK